jgi:hypothetical protein
MRGPPSGRAQEGRRQPAPRQDQRVLEQDQCILRQIFRGSFLDAKIAKLLFGITESACLINKRTGSARGPYKPACSPSHKREVIGGAPEWCAPFGLLLGYPPIGRLSRVPCCSAVFLGVDRGSGC